MKRIACFVGAFGLVLGSAACTKTVDGKPSAAAGQGSKSSSKSSDKSSSGKSSGKSSSKSSSASSGSSSNQPAPPGQPYSYTDGTSVSIDAPVPKDDISGLLSDETGRVLGFHIDNKSQYTLDLSTTTMDAEVTCGSTKEWVFYDEDLGGAEQLPPAQKGDYKLYVGVKKSDVGKTCTVTFPFKTTDYSVDVDEATFSVVMS